MPGETPFQFETGSEWIAESETLSAAAIAIADSWADYVVFGAFFLTFLGFAIAINKRQYPTKKRGFTRDSDSRW